MWTRSAVLLCRAEGSRDGKHGKGGTISRMARPTIRPAVLEVTFTVPRVRPNVPRAPASLPRRRRGQIAVAPARAPSQRKVATRNSCLGTSRRLGSCLPDRAQRESIAI